MSHNYITPHGAKVDQQSENRGDVCNSAGVGFFDAIVLSHILHKDVWIKELRTQRDDGSQRLLLFCVSLAL